MKSLQKLWVFTVLLFSIAANAQMNADPAGKYENKLLGLQVVLQKNSSGLYEGTISLLQESYKAVAQWMDGRLTGQYQYQGANIPFVIAQLDGKYYIESEGMSYELSKIGSSKQPVGSSSSNAMGALPAVSANTSAGSRKTDPYGGYSFVVPQGWQCEEEKGSFVLSKPGTAWRIGIGPHNYSNRNAALQEAIAMQPIQDQQSGTYLQPRAEAIGNEAIRLKLSGQSQGSPLTIETLNVFSQHGGGASLVAVMQGQDDPDAFPILKSIASTLQFSVAQQSPQAKTWDQKLRGKQLLYLNTQGGGSDKVTVNLYADGRFEYSSSSNYMSGGSSVFTYADKNGGRGTWKIVQRGQQVVLLIFYENGSTEEYPLQQGQSANEVYSQNRRYFIRSIQ